MRLCYNYKILKVKKVFTCFIFGNMLILLLVTGGITTVAILQGNETGSDMNTRQAYISAKSGLDTMEDALKTEFIDDTVLPSAVGGERFLVLYEDASGVLQKKSFATEADAQAEVKQLEKMGTL